MQFVQAGLTHRVGAAQADRLVAAAVELIVADGTGQELRPLGRLHRHPATTPLREASLSSVGMHVNETRQQLLLASANDDCEEQDVKLCRNFFRSSHINMMFVMEWSQIMPKTHVDKCNGAGAAILDKR